ncbi:MAG: hypothetical protein ACK46L_01920 [Synechococcaceae cyanobacterium]
MTFNATSAAVRSQLIQALELDLVGPTPGLLAQLEAEGQSQEATELREELLDRPPNRWYQTGFLIPSETSLGERANDAADDEFAGLDGQNLSAKRKSNASGDDTGASEAGPARRVFFPCSVGLSLLIPPASGLDQGAGFLDGGGAITQLFRQAAIEPGIGLGQLTQGGAHGVSDLTHGHRLPWFDPGAAAGAVSRLVLRAAASRSRH